MLKEMTQEEKKNHSHALCLQTTEYLKNLEEQPHLFDALAIISGAFVVNTLAICNALGSESLFLATLDSLKNAYLEAKKEGTENE